MEEEREFSLWAVLMKTDFNLKFYSDETSMVQKGQSSSMYVNCSNVTMLRIRSLPLSNAPFDFSPVFHCHSEV